MRNMTETKSNAVFIALLMVLFTIVYAKEVSFAFKPLYW